MQNVKIFILSFLFTFLFSSSVLRITYHVSASHCSSTDYDCQIQEIQREIDALKPAHERNKEELAELRKQLTDIQKRLGGIASQLKKLEADIAAREEDLALQEALLHRRVRSFYMFSRQYSPITVFLASQTATEFSRQLTIREQVAAEDRRIIEELSSQLLKLREDKVKLERSRAGLQGLQAQVDARADFLAGEVEKVESYLSQLTARQRELEAAKAGGFQTSIGDVPPTLEPCSGAPGSSNFCDPGIRPAFAAFSFGAPHRKGMSQYGALGRAKAGQNYETLLRAYYGDVRIVDVNTSLVINTAAGSMDFENRYMMGIAEMPSRWADEGGMEALRAQSIAARSYALSYVGWRMGNQNATGTICVTEACQVWKAGKADNPGRWREAVDSTRGKIMVSNSSGELVNSWYASTAGGFVFSYTSLGHTTPGLWDADGGQGGWPANAWDNKAGSPWFYKGWYRSRGGASCGRAHPWLTSEEMSDILNAWHVLYKGGGDVSRISPTDTSCWGGNPYSLGELRGIAGYISVSSASVVYGNNGSTLSVTFSTNKGTITISGEEFKRAFNLRAPGYIGLKSSLFNIEKL